MQEIGERERLAGDLAAAEEHLLAALASEPSDAQAAESLCAVYLRQLQEEEQEADHDHADCDHADCDHHVHEKTALDELLALMPERILAPVRRDGAELRRRASHFNLVALELAPGRPFNHECAAELLRLEGRRAEAIAAWRRARELDPGRARSLSGLARELSEEGALADAQALLEEGLSTLQEDRQRLARPLLDVLGEVGSGEAAAARLRQLAEERLSDEALLREAAFILDEEQEQGHAIGLLRALVERAPGDSEALCRLGTLLGESLLTREEARQLLARAVELAPDEPAPRRALAWLLLEEDPARGLALLESQEDPYTQETRSALLAALGRDEESRLELERALEAAPSPIAALCHLSDWHLAARRHGRALLLARQIFERPVPEDLVDAADYAWLRAHRGAGEARASLARVRELCDPDVPDFLACDIYWAYRWIDHRLAARAAQAHSEILDEDGPEELEWRVRAAGQRAQAGDEAELLLLREELGDAAGAWASLSREYLALGRPAEADDAARRAFELDGSSLDVLLAMVESRARRGRPEEAIGCARRILELRPLEHQGPERVALLCGKLLQVEEALACSARAVDAAPRCHVAQASRAVALFAAGDLDAAELFAREALALEPPERQDDDSDELILLRALTGDVDGLARCLATRARTERAEVFAAFKERLLEVSISRPRTSRRQGPTSWIPR